VAPVRGSTTPSTHAFRVALPPLSTMTRETPEYETVTVRGTVAACPAEPFATIDSAQRPDGSWSGMLNDIHPGRMSEASLRRRPDAVGVTDAQLINKEAQ